MERFMLTLCQSKGRKSPANAAAVRRDKKVIMQEPSEIQDSTDLYKSIFENALEGIYQSSPEGRYLRVNPALARMYGFETPEELESCVHDIPHQIYVDPQKRLEFESRMERENRVIGLEYQVRRADGSLLWISEVARAVRDHSGKLLYYEGFIQDISDRKKSEEERFQLEERLKIAQKLEAIGALARGVAHDFNNILAGIIGYTEIAMEERSNPENLPRYLDAILKGSKRAHDLVSKMLLLSQQSFPKREKICAMESILSALQLAPAPDGVQVHLSKNNNKSSFLFHGDPEQIKLVLTHLLDNAYHAVKGLPSANIWIDVSLSGNFEKGSRTLPLSDSSEGPLTDQNVVIKIRDNGAGITEENLPHIFDPFFTTRPVGEGSGLGLSVCHGIVKSHGGYIRVQNPQGGGAEFILGFSAIDQRSISKKAFPKESLMLASHGLGAERLELAAKHVMIVDDEKALLNILERKLTQAGFKVSSFDDPLRALKEFRSNPMTFDILVTDFSMPNLSGIELASEIHSSRPGLPTIVCTGFSDEHLSERIGLDQDIVKLTKPFDISELQELILKTIKQQNETAKHEPELQNVLNDLIENI